MSEIQTTRIGLPTGVTLKVAFAGPAEAEPILFLHGFPESFRTWRHEMNALARDFRVIAPNQRGYAGSDKPEDLEDYQTEKMVEDVIALADALGLARFTLVGHDWGGVIAWAAAIRHPERLKRLVIVNAPHPLLFQRSLIEDEAQREASQYIRALKTPGAETAIKVMGLRTFLEKVLGAEGDLAKLPEAERQAYVDEWSEPGALTGMINWYRAMEIEVPEPGEKARLPLWTHLPFPKVKVPTLVIWAMKDKALLPVQLEGLIALVEDLRIVTAMEAGHFVTWDDHETVTSAIRDFIADTAEWR